MGGINSVLILIGFFDFIYLFHFTVTGRVRGLFVEYSNFRHAVMEIVPGRRGSIGSYFPFFK